MPIFGRASLSGARELDVKLSKLSRSLGKRALRNALYAASKPVIRRMQAKAPVGTKPHKTYRGRLVQPGYLKRSVKSYSFIDKTIGQATVKIGVHPEAFYGINFIDQGPWTISSRRYSTRKGTRRRNIKPYTLKKVPWFQSTYISSRKLMEREIVRNLDREIKKVIRDGSSR